MMLVVLLTTVKSVRHGYNFSENFRKSAVLLLETMMFKWCGIDLKS